MPGPPTPGPPTPGPPTPGPPTPGLTAASGLTAPSPTAALSPAAPGLTAAWDRLRSAAPLLYPPMPRPAASLRPVHLRPSTITPLDCEVCRGPVRPGYARCFQCERHDLLGHGLLADVVVPVSYAIRSTALADALWRYKSRSAPAASAPARVLALLLAFLHDHGPCVWGYAATPPPDRLAVVPTGSGRPGPHPLLGLVSPYLRRPACPLAIRPGRQGRDLDLDRFQAAQVPVGASVLLLDDTWVSGASAQSAAAALKLAGARHVMIVVLGRHVNPADPAAASLLAALTPAGYDPSACAVHRPK
jgi:hypothetical protein